MALDASKNNRVLEKKTSVMVYSDLYDIGKPLTEEEILNFISFENFLVEEFLNLSKSSQARKKSQYKKYLEANKYVLPETKKKELCKGVYEHINENKKYKYSNIEKYDGGIVVFYHDLEKNTKNKFDITYKEHAELENILKFKYDDMKYELREFVSNNKDLNKSLLNKINITIELLSQINK